MYWTPAKILLLANIDATDSQNLTNEKSTLTQVPWFEAIWQQAITWATVSQIYIAILHH